MSIAATVYCCYMKYTPNGVVRSTSTTKSSRMVVHTLNRIESDPPDECVRRAILHEFFVIFLPRQWFAALVNV